MYEKIGDNEAVFFFDVDRNNGTVYIINNLLTDRKVSYTVSVRRILFAKNKEEVSAFADFVCMLLKW